MSRQTVTLELAIPVTIVVDMDERVIDSAKFKPASGQATFIPNSVGERAAFEVLRESDLVVDICAHDSVIECAQLELGERT